MTWLHTRGVVATGVADAPSVWLLWLTRLPMHVLLLLILFLVSLLWHFLQLMIELIQMIMLSLLLMADAPALTAPLSGPGATDIMRCCAVRAWRHRHMLRCQGLEPPTL